MLSKHRIASLLQHMPFLAFLISWVYRFSVPRFSAGVSGVLFDDAGRVLLLEHVYHARRPWGLPGGWLDRGEAPDLAITREFAEETQLTVEVVSLLTVEKDTFWRQHLNVGYLMRCPDLGQAIQLSHESRSYAWVLPGELPAMDGFQRRLIEHALAYRTAERE